MQIALLMKPTACVFFLCCNLLKITDEVVLDKLKASVAYRTLDYTFPLYCPHSIPFSVVCHSKNLQINSNTNEICYVGDNEASVGCLQVLLYVPNYCA